MVAARRAEPIWRIDVLITPTTRTNKRIDIPHEPGQWIEIQRLAWSELPMGSVRTDPRGYMLALFAAAVTAWSYPAPVKDSLEYLDDITAGWLYVEIDKFVHHVESEAERGNATAPSSTS
jgi:hypothetical protein